LLINVCPCYLTNLKITGQSNKTVILPLTESRKTLFINAVTFLSLVLLVEFLLFLGLVFPSSIPSFLLSPYRLYYQSSDRNIIQVTPCAQYDSGLFYMLKPGTCFFENREFNVENRINMAGLRDDDASLQNPSVVVLGDSYAMGWGVNQDEAFPQLLEETIEKPVLNAGISSFGTARAVKLFNRLNLSDVRAIIFQYHANDFEENETFIKHDYKLPIRSKETYDSLCKNINEREDYYPLKHLYGLTKAVSRKLLNKPPKVISDVTSAQAFFEVINHLKINRDSVQILVFKVDDYDRINDSFALTIDSLSNTPTYSGWNIKTIKLEGVLLQDDYFVLDDHINAQGHLKIAQKLAQSLKPISD